ncbi:hypothetical protein NDU88_000304 [Pleurodeles waltl]|uniref:Uncharacterized protein n=1 Tax=Pleurodeles waltl TaxID=8319 RepID=A0AAV7TGR7_PLEWA|nr:hypothetical protein NDU88_000304 [Pleurodeles waltl]
MLQSVTRTSPQGTKMQTLHTELMHKGGRAARQCAYGAFILGRALIRKRGIFTTKQMEETAAAELTTLGDCYTDRTFRSLEILTIEAKKAGNRFLDLTLGIPCRDIAH